MSSDPSQSDSGSDAPSESGADAPPEKRPRAARKVAVPAEDATETAAAEGAVAVEDKPVSPPVTKLRPRPTPPRETSPLDPELDRAREAVLAAVEAWLINAWEQPIIRSLTSNPTRAVESKDAFPALRTALRGLQADAHTTVVDAIGPLLDRDVKTRELTLLNSIDSASVQLVGLIGVALVDHGFDPMAGGLERWQDGYRLKTMSEHEAVTAAVKDYVATQAAVAAEIAERLQRERNEARAEVERLWQETATAD